MNEIDVLNAFRHHRGRHLKEADFEPGENTCSTPFGITEVGTLRVGPVDGLLRVLNAFRHHRGRHVRIAISPARR